MSHVMYNNVICNVHVAIYRLYATKLHRVHWAGIHVILIRKKNSLNIPHTHTQYDKSCQLHYLCHFLRLIYTSILIGFNPERIPIRVFTRESTYNLIQITTIHLVRWIKSMWLGIAFWCAAHLRRCLAILRQKIVSILNIWFSQRQIWSATHFQNACY